MGRQAHRRRRRCLNAAPCPARITVADAIKVYLRNRRNRESRAGQPAEIRTCSRASCRRSPTVAATSCSISSPRRTSTFSTARATSAFARRAKMLEKHPHVLQILRQPRIHCEVARQPRPETADRRQPHGEQRCRSPTSSLRTSSRPAIRSTDTRRMAAGATVTAQVNWTGEDLKDFIWLMTYTGLRISDVVLFDMERLHGNEVFLTGKEERRGGVRLDSRLAARSASGAGATASASSRS